LALFGKAHEFSQLKAWLGWMLANPSNSDIVLFGAIPKNWSTKTLDDH